MINPLLVSQIEKFKMNTATIGIIGLGYVGLPLLIRYSEVGYKVIGIDIDHEKIDHFNESRSYIQHIPDTVIEKCKSQGVEVTTDFKRVEEVDAVIICVPTPLNAFREPDLTFVISTIDYCLPHLKQGQVISLESTTYPGTTDEELKPRIESTGLIVGKDLFLVYSPEREDPGNPTFNTQTIPKVCGGSTPACLELGISLYEKAIDQVVPVGSTKAAELTKLLENICKYWPS